MTSTDDELVGMDHYLKKTFHKTAALMANSAKAISILGEHPPDVISHLYHQMSMSALGL